MTIKRILVIDDEASIREVVQACLVALGGWTVMTAASGKEGLLTAEAETPDAILLDVSMPEMDGLATFEKLQENPNTRSIPVILLTAKVQAVEQSQYAQLGVTGLIMKPFDPVQLCHQITEILDRK